MPSYLRDTFFATKFDRDDRDEIVLRENIFHNESNLVLRLPENSFLKQMIAVSFSRIAHSRILNWNKKFSIWWYLSGKKIIMSHTQVFIPFRLLESGSCSRSLSLSSSTNTLSKTENHNSHSCWVMKLSFPCVFIFLIFLSNTLTLGIQMYAAFLLAWLPSQSFGLWKVGNILLQWISK